MRWVLHEHRLDIKARVFINWSHMDRLYPMPRRSLHEFNYFIIFFFFFKHRLIDFMEGKSIFQFYEVHS